MRKMAILLLWLVMSVPLRAAEIAVIPYRVENSSDNFNENTGTDYAKLLGLALVLKKGMEPYSFRDLEIDMKSFSIDPRRSVSGESLDALGKGRFIDLMLTGTLSRSGGVYISESVLYSTVQRKVVARERVRADNLFALAERDIREIFVTYPDRNTPVAGDASIDVVLVLDTSYNVSREWDAVRNGIAAFASGLSGDWEASLRLYIAPFSGAPATPKAIRAITSPLSLKQELTVLRTGGGAGPEALGRALSLAVDAVPWRAEAKKVMLVISNSPARDVSRAERYALKARKKGIAIYTVPLARIGRDEAEAMRQVAITGRGRSLPAAYRQRVYDAEGRAIDLFMQSGRLFHARSFGDQWKSGLFVEGGGGRTVRPKPFLSELFYDEKRYDVNAYTMGERYGDIAGVRIINRERLESNVDALLAGLGESHAVKIARGGAAKAAAKVLIADERLSVWLQVSDGALVEFFEKQATAGRYITLGVMVRIKEDEPYGFDFSPRRILSGLDADQIPGLAMATLRGIADRPGYYTANGLMRPPMWFIRVKVERVERLRDGADIRD